MELQRRALVDALVQRAIALLATWPQETIEKAVVEPLNSTVELSPPEAGASDEQESATTTNGDVTTEEKAGENLMTAATVDVELARIIATLQKLLPANDVRVADLQLKQAERLGQCSCARQLKYALQLYDERPSEEVHERIAALLGSDNSDTAATALGWTHMARFWRELRPTLFPASYDLF